MLKWIIPVGAIALTLAPGVAGAIETIVIGAGAKGGSYYRYGQAVCTLLARRSSEVRCDVESMPAGDASESFANIVNVRDGAVEVGIARSDWIHFAYTGTGPVRYMHTKFDSIRSLFSIHALPLTLLAKRNLGIGGVGDLKGRRVNLGRPHSDGRRRIEMLMAAKGWTKKDFLLAEELTPEEQSLSFCHDWVEGIVYLVNHPSTTVRRLTKLCDATVVDVSGPAVDQVVAENPYLALTTIPGGLYEGSPDPVNSFGTTIALVTSSDTPEAVVYSAVKTIFENLNELKRIHPGLHYLDPAKMIDGLSAPFHDGARRYFREQGWL